MKPAAGRIPPSPRRISIDITTHCNLKCSYCYHFNSPGEVDHDLPAEAWCRFFAELKREHVLQVAFAGGEPFCRSDLRSLLETAADCRLRFSFASNGTLITGETARFLAECGRCDAVQVSIDGSRRAHEACRGAGTFEPAIRGIRLLQEAGVPVQVRVTLSRRNVGTLAETAKLLLEELGLPAFSTNSVLVAGSCLAAADTLELCPEEFAASMREHRKIASRYPGRIRATAGPLAALRSWSRMLQAVRENADPESGGGRLSSCSGVFRELGVLADGTFIACTQLPDAVLGRINQDSLQEVWLRARPLLELRNRKLRKLRELPFCRTCPYVDYCRGGCPAERPDPEAQPPLRSCLRRFLESVGNFEFLSTDCNL